MNIFCFDRDKLGMLERERRKERKTTRVKMRHQSHLSPNHKHRVTTFFPLFPSLFFPLLPFCLFSSLLFSLSLLHFHPFTPFSVSSFSPYSSFRKTPKKRREIEEGKNIYDHSTSCPKQQCTPIHCAGKPREARNKGRQFLK